MKKLLLISALAILGGNTAMAQCPSGEVPVTVSISTDPYGSETTWTLISAGVTLASGGPYANQSSAGAFPQTPVTVCIPVGVSVVFKINDAYGDGMCCTYGNGHYDVSMNGCTTVASGGEFGASQSTTFTTAAAAALDLSLVSVNMTDVALAGNMSISGQVKNLGSTDITSYDVNYSVDGGALVTQSMSNAIASCSTYDFTHNTPWPGTPGYHTVVVSVSNVNGSTDDVPSNDSKTITTSMASQTVSRVVAVEEFGSSTCPPCASFDTKFSPAMAGMNANQAGSSLAAVSYHMNWPSPSNDRSYNPDGNTRRGYYGVSGIPELFIDGKDSPIYSSTSAASLTADFNAAAAVPAFMDLDCSYTLSGNAITVNATVTPHFDVPNGYKLYIAVTEDHYVDPMNTTGQTNYHYSMRKMLPNGSGTNLGAFVDGQPQTVTQSYTLVLGNPAQGNYNLWGSLSGITVMAFVQKTATKQVFQGAIATLSTGVSDLGRDNSLLNVWPNPTAGTVNLRYGKTTSSPAHMEVYNVLGDRVMDVQRSFTNGQTQILDLTNLGNGMYLLSITADGVRSTSRVTVNK